ncbi:ATP-binding protein [Bradyrhizobium sp. B025]|uniref:ATP-binding protein n=1 Tax=Bradyrhizobium sp. B025 TaxID=3344829 RepID=UPI0035D3F219
MSNKVTRAKIWTEFQLMRIEHGRLPVAHKIFDDLREARRKAPLEPQQFAALFAPTHSGKSMAVRMYRETVVAAEAIERGLFPATMDRKEIANAQRIVLHITLEGVTSIKNLAEEILLCFGVKEKGSTNSLLKLAYDYLKKFEVELLIIDEVQHLKTTKEKNKFAELREGETALTNTFKTMLIRGLVPMVFIGITEARPLVFNDEQLADRCLVEIDYDCLDFAVKAERDIFLDYCGRVGLKLKQHGLFEEASNFLAQGIPACLHAASTGRIGIVSRIVMQAATFAAEEGAPQVLREHLKKAVDAWAIPRKVTDYNPFRDGVRQLEILK